MRFARKCICASRVSQIRPGFLTTFTDVKIWFWSRNVSHNENSITLAMYKIL
jgi:hypothetical protein